MKKLKVDLEEIGMHMETRDRYDQDYYLDKESGEVEILLKECMDVVEGGREIDDLPDWQKEMVKTAEDILYTHPDRYEWIPEKPSYEGYNLMVEFAESVEDERLGEKLAIALDGKGAFRRFKNVLYDYPEYREEWFKFKQRRMNQEVIEWLQSIGIEPISSEKEG